MKELWDLIQDQLGPEFVADPGLQADVRTLSEFLTSGREDLPADYLADSTLQAAYLAYFLPLNFEKVRLLLASHAGTWPPEPPGPQRWADLGAGPGTATLAALAALKDRYKKHERFAPVHIDLIDTQTEALVTARELVEGFASKLGLEARVALHPTFASARASAGESKYDLALAANVLNELPPEDGTQGRELLAQLWDATGGAMLVLEPGHRVSSQRLVRFRERLLRDAGSGARDARILGPCRHAAKCPVHRTKHWCHFSEPLRDGRLIDLNLRIFRDPRSWLKFSYLLVRRGTPPEWDGKTYRAIGDLHRSGPGLSIDLCRPSEKFVLHVPRNLPPDLRSNLVRGSLVVLDGKHHVDGKPHPMSKRAPDAKPEMRARRRRPEPSRKR